MFNRLFPDAPTLRQLPRVLFNVAVFGALVGPPFSLVMAWIVSAPFGRMMQKPVQWLLFSAAIGVAFGLAFYLTCGLPLGYVRRRLVGAPAWYARLVTGLAGLAGGMLGCLVSLGAVRLMFGSGLKLIIPLSQIAVVDGIIAMVIALALNAWARLRAEKELAAARAQSKVLQAQINPHFFFNTLNTISALITVDPDAAQRTIGVLADMSRYAFASAQSDVVPLARELDFARSYLEIEQARFGSRLRFTLPEPSNAGDISLPALTLQPLIENAVRHGIARRIEGGLVSVRLDRNGTRYSLAVENETDSPADLSEGAFFRPGHALANIRDRLRIAYNGQASIAVHAPRPCAVAVTIDAPLAPCQPAA